MNGCEQCRAVYTSIVVISASNYRFCSTRCLAQWSTSIAERTGQLGGEGESTGSGEGDRERRAFYTGVLACALGATIGAAVGTVIVLIVGRA